MQNQHIIQLEIGKNDIILLVIVQILRKIYRQLVSQFQ